MRDRALDLWATTAKTDQQIAEEVGCAVGSVQAFVSAARRRDEKRGFARKLPHADRPTQPAPSAPLQAEDREKTITMGEQVIRLWSTTQMSREEIADAVGCKLDSIDSFLTQARAKGDRRGFARRTVTQTFGSVPDEIDEREPPVSGFAKPVTQAPFTPADLAPLMGIGMRPDAKITEASVVGIDPVGCIIRGPLADWTTDAPTMRTIRKMNVPGSLFDKKTLLEAGPWPGIETFERRLPMIKRHLAAIGVDFVDLKGAGCRIRVAGT